MSQQLAHKFSLPFEADIWEVRASGNYLLVTTRDNEQLQVRFSLFDMTENEFVWKDVSFEESWWISVYHFVDGIVVFQTYPDTQDIESRSVFGFDILTMEALWSVDDVKVRLKKGSILELTFLDNQEERLFIDIKTGETSENFMERGEVDLNNAQDQFVPRHYEKNSEHFETLSNFLSNTLNLELEGSCDYLETEGFFAISANSRSEIGYNLDLFVFDHDGRLLLRELLDTDMKGLATGTFFKVGQALIFVQGKRHLVFYSF